jgi:hypothetical protein
MLGEMKTAAAEPGRHVAGFAFEWTSHWDAFVARTMPQSMAAEPALASLHRGVIDELRLEGEESYRRVRERARLRLLANREANRLGLQASPEAKRASLGRMRAELGLFTRAELEAWLQRNHLDPLALEQLIEEDVRAPGRRPCKARPLVQHGTAHGARRSHKITARSVLPLSKHCYPQLKSSFTVGW